MIKGRKEMKRRKYRIGRKRRKERGKGRSWKEDGETKRRKGR